MILINGKDFYKVKRIIIIKFKVNIIKIIDLKIIIIKIKIIKTLNKLKKE
jgi:hypothetical protein